MVKAKESKEVVNDSGIPLKVFYGPKDSPIDLSKIGEPGKYPFTRGIHPEGYRKRLWTMRQYAGYGTARQTNERFKVLLSHGQTGLSTAFDLPTQMGYNSDHPMARGEVGKVGVAIDSLADMEICFNGIPLDRISTSMTINATAPILLALYIAVGKKQGVSPEKLKGTTQNDILKEYVARGTYIFPPRPSLRLATDLIEYGAENIPGWNTVSVSGYHIRDAGSTAVQEMAFALANAIAYVTSTLERGVDIDAFAPRISWIFNTHNDFFQEIAKYRALRRIWARLMKDRFGAKEERSWLFRTHIQTGGVTCYAQQPENNIVRAAYQALASVLGGIQSMALSCYDEALAIPTPFAQQMALRTQQILAHETGVTKVVDPLGGSWYIESLTDQLEQGALELLDRVEQMGGAVAAIETKFMHKEIEEASYQYQKEVEEGSRVIVGLNRYTETVKPEEEKTEIFRVDPRLEEDQKRFLSKVKAERDPSAVQKTLARLKEAAQGTENLMAPLIEAVEAYATLGEISDTLREVFGTYDK